MSETNEFPLERVQSSFKQLTAAASNLNTASDELGKSIAELDAALKKLNLGVPAWVVIDGGNDQEGDYWSREIGFDKVGKQWGIALKTIFGNYVREEYSSSEEWLFNDAPRWLRIEAVDRIPQLLEELAKEADGVTKKIKKKAGQAQQLAAAINTAAEVQVKK